MKGIYRRQFESVEQTLVVCDKRPEAFRGSPVADESLAQLRTEVAVVRTADADHQIWLLQARSRTVDLQGVRDWLTGALTSIANTSPLVARHTGTKEVFELPKEFNDRDLVAIAKDFAAKVPPLADAFVAAKLDPAIITNLPVQIEAMETALRDRRAARRAHKLSLGNARAAVRRAGEARDALERVYMNALGHDEAAVREWKEARRVGPSRPKPAAAPAPQPPVTKAS